MTSGITYSTPSYARPARVRTAPASTSRTAASEQAGGLRAALDRLRAQRWFRWLDEVPAALVDDVAPGPHTVATELRSEVSRLDAALRVRLY